MNQAATTYLPADPMDLMNALEGVCNLTDGAKIIGVIVVIEDEDNVHTAALGHSDARKMVIKAVRGAMNTMEIGEPTGVFHKTMEANDVRH